MSGQTWERAAEDALDGAGTGIVGDVAGHATDQGAEAGQVSGETVEETFEQVVERVLAAKIGSLRQDLSTDIERRVQSFSDKTADRLSREQRARLEMLDQVMDGLKETLGPDFDQVKRQRQLDILLGEGTPQGTQSPQRAGETPAIQGAQTAQGADGFAEAYLSTRLGDPSQYSAEEQAAIRRDLSSARDWGAWMETVERYATQRAGRLATSGQAQPSRAARAQPVQTGRPSGGPMTPEQLQKAYNAAATNSDMAEMTQLGVLIDKLVQR